MSNIKSENKKFEIITEGGCNQPAIVRIDQQEYQAFEHDPTTIPILENVAKELLLRELPSGIALTPCKRIQFLADDESDLEIPLSPSQFEGIAPFRIYYLENGNAGIIISWHCTKDFWSNDSGYRWKLHRARTAVLAQRKTLSQLRFYRFVDNGYLAGIEFITSLQSKTLETVIQTAYAMTENIYSAIQEATEIKTDQASNELTFTRDTFIPLLKKLGFKNVVFHHGTREFGKDVLFYRQTEFGMPEYWAAQVKLGNVSGKSNSFIDLIVHQAQDAFKMPLHDIQTKSKFWISKFAVVITGKFTENAVEKICEKIEVHSQRNNIMFIDGEKLEELIQSSGLNKRPYRRRKSL